MALTLQSSRPIMTSVLALLLTGLSYLFWQHLSWRRHRRTESLRRGCKPLQRAGLWMGIQHMVGIWTGLIWGFKKKTTTGRVGGTSKIPQMIHSTFDRNGMTWGLTVLGRRLLVFTADPENMRAILATNFADFGVAPGRHHALAPLLGDGIFSVDGPQWHSARALLRPHFTKTRTNNLASIEPNVQRLLQALLPLPQNKENEDENKKEEKNEKEERGKEKGKVTVDVLPVLDDFATASATRFILGTSDQDALNPPPGKEYKGLTSFTRAIVIAQVCMATRSDLGGFLTRFLTKDGDKFWAACKLCRDTISTHLPGSGRSRKQYADQDDRDASFLNHAAKVLDDRELAVDQALSAFFAARDTTTAALGWMFHALARKPDVLRNLRAEIIGLLGEGEDARNPTLADFRELVYLKGFINEVLRLYGPVPMNGRYALKDTTLPRGGGEDGLSPIFIGKDDIVSYWSFTMHRRTDIYGPDAEKFRPERWDENGRLRDFPGTSLSYTFLPFSAGPRICLGQELALNTISYTLIRLLQTFSDIVLVRPEGDSPDDDDDTDFENTIGMVMAPPPGSIIELTPVST